LPACRDLLLPGKLVKVQKNGSAQAEQVNPQLRPSAKVALPEPSFARRPLTFYVAGPNDLPLARFVYECFSEDFAVFLSRDHL
jgi:hypothetical protein